jgi:sugar transferase (PEP-CTERM/EpsH1 system associated)
MPDQRPLVLHVMYRFDTGGLENGIVNLINHMPPDAYRHAVLALTDVTDFRQRIQRTDVGFISLRKPPGHGVWQYPKLFELFRQFRPAIVHSRNLAALEVQAPAWAAGVPVRIHGEHGRGMEDQDGNGATYQRVRRLYRPFVNHYTALSRDLADYLVDKVNVSPKKITQVYNGVDADRFCPSPNGPQSIAGCPFDPEQHWLVGTVGRMQTVKDQVMLAHAFVHALVLAPELRIRMRLVMVGEGPLCASPSRSERGRSGCAGLVAR